MNANTNIDININIHINININTQSINTTYINTNANSNTNTDINTTNTGPTSIQGANLIIGSAAGNLKTADKIYEVRLQTDITGEQTAALGHFGTIAFRIT